MRKLCRFHFPQGTDLQLVEQLIADAIFGVESIVGPSQARLDAAYCISSEKSGCVIDVTYSTGEMVAKAFVGLLNRELGEDGYRVERIDGDPRSASSGGRQE